MDRSEARLVGRTPETDAYCTMLMQRAAEVRLPALFQEQRVGIVWRTPERRGVTTIAVRRSSLSDEELLSILRYRLGQYVHPSIGIIDPRMVTEARMEHEPLENESRCDIHFLSGIEETGEILCYAILRALPCHELGLTLRDRDRPLLPVEKVNGWGVFNRLEVLPDLPLHTVFELGRYIKNHCRPSDDPATRAPTETALAVFRSIAGPLYGEVLGFVGDLEERIAKRTLDFFHIPTVLIRGVVPFSPEASYFFPRNQYCTVYPFAVLADDLKSSLPRFEAIEAALTLPGAGGLKALFALKKSSASLHSSLEPEGGLAPLTSTELPDQGGEMRSRELLLDIAADLRQFDAFTELSDSEMRLLGGFMGRCFFNPGDVVVRMGEREGDLYLIDQGTAAVWKRDHDGEPAFVNTLKRGDYFGEIALLHGGVRTADVIARTHMRLFRLKKEAFERFLAELDEVRESISKTAASRL